MKRLVATLGLTVALMGAGVVQGTPVQAGAPHVLLVCNGSTSPCPAGGPYYTTIQAAVSATVPGDWVLIWPGIYHETGALAGPDQAGVSITTPGIHLRGMDRNKVVVDGTTPGAGPACPSDPARQVITSNGRDGIDVWKVDGTSIDNLTVCNFLSNSGGSQGNEIWWNGGDGSGKIGLHSYWGSYLTATSTYYKDANSAMGMYGIFVSNASGPGSVSYAYASNMGDSGFYIGACPDCNATLDHVHAQNSSLGYSGTNAGGNLVIENSEWDHNKSGIVPNSLNNSDAPSPQNGKCPNGAPGPLGNYSCTLIHNNYVHDNNNPNVPASGTSGLAPVGTGIEISGGEFDSIYANRVENQGAWGIVTHDYPDPETPPPGVHCGGIQIGSICFFNARGNEVGYNYLSHNGFFGNPTNGDLANEATAAPRNCFVGNTDPISLTSTPANIQSPSVDGPPCSKPGPGGKGLFVQIACDSGILPCPPGTSYPRPTKVTLLPLTPQPTMPNPCAGVPANPWCPSSSKGR